MSAALQVITDVAVVLSHDDRPHLLPEAREVVLAVLRLRVAGTQLGSSLPRGTTQTAAPLRGHSLGRHRVVVVVVVVVSGGGVAVVVVVVVVVVVDVVVAVAIFWRRRNALLVLALQSPYPEPLW